MRSSWIPASYVGRHARARLWIPWIANVVIRNDMGDIFSDSLDEACVQAKLGALKIALPKI